MDELLIGGYAAYTTADEFGAVASGDAPASAETVMITIASAAFGASTVTQNC